MAKPGKEKPWPVVVIPDPSGALFIRWFAGREDVLRALRGRSDDDVLYIDLDGIRIEVSFHRSPADARKARDRDIARGLLSVTPAAGNS